MNSGNGTKSHFSNVRKHMKLRIEDIGSVSKSPFEIKGLSTKTTYVNQRDILTA